MDIVASLQSIMMVGSEWILFLLLALSVGALSIVFERVLYFRSIRPTVPKFAHWLTGSMKESRLSEIENVCRSCASPEARLTMVFLSAKNDENRVVDGHLSSFLMGVQHDLDRNLPFLGTLGNNAPFIGLLGTVFGVISAFHHLAATGIGNSSIVMAGISEALVATGIGLFVAIPAVVAFNIFTRMIKRRMTELAQIKQLLLTLHFSMTAQAPVGEK